MTRAALLWLGLAAGSGCAESERYPCTPTNVVGTWGRLYPPPPLQSHTLTLRADGVADERTVSRDVETMETEQGTTTSSWTVVDSKITIRTTHDAAAAACVIFYDYLEEMEFDGKAYVRTGDR